MNAVSDWITFYKFDNELKQLNEIDPLTTSFAQKLLDYDLSFYFSTDAADAVLSMLIYIDNVQIPAEKQKFIREWITYRNIEIDVGSFQIIPDSKNIYYNASIDMHRIDEIDLQLISNLYVRGRKSVAMHMHEFLNLVKT
jgi:hypothetical protein